MARSRCQHAALRTVVVVIAVLLSGSEALAQRILRVPSEYPTIQAAIDAAETNDTVQVAEGNYSQPGNIDFSFRGKSITVRPESGRISLFWINGEPGFPGIRFESGETHESMLQGITFVAEFGVLLRISQSHPTIIDCEFRTWDSSEPNIRLIDSNATLSQVTAHAWTGVGASMLNSNPVCTDCIFEGAHLRNSGPTFTRCEFIRSPELNPDPAGLAMSDSSPLLVDCLIADNPARPNELGHGVSITRGSPTFLRCIIRNNTSPEMGGGIYCINSDARFEECFIAENTAGSLALGDGGGAYVEGGAARFIKCRFERNLAGRFGGGAFVDGQATFDECVFESNEAGLSGGGAHGTATFIDSLFASNRSHERGGGATAEGGTVLRCEFNANAVNDVSNRVGRGGGLYLSDAIVLDSLFAANVTQDGPGFGGGMYADGASIARGCTWVHNSATTAGGGAYLSDSIASMANSVLWANGDAQVGGSGSVSWSNIQGGYPGEGNIDLDPRFIDPANGDYRLGDGSPCIDAGSNALVPPESEFDLDGLPRFVNDPGMPDMGEGTAPIADMGCYEFQSSSTGLNLRVRASCPTGGPARIGWANGSPDRTAVLLISPQTGRVRIPNRYPCAGTELGLASSGLRLAWQGRNDAGGGRVLNAPAPPGACGQFVQLLDLSTCNVSEVVGIE